MKHLLIVYHSKTGNTEALIQAVTDGASTEDVEGVAVRLRRAAEADAQDLLWAHALVLGTPENFGYMSGALKDFFDRTFYEVEGRLNPLPYAVVISAGNDGSNALRAIRRIANGYPFQEVQEAIIVPGTVSEAALEQCRALGMAFAYGLEAGIF